METQGIVFCLERGNWNGHGGQQSFLTQEMASTSQGTPAAEAGTGPDFSHLPLWTQVEASYPRCLLWAATHQLRQAKVTLVIWLSSFVYCFQQFLLCTPCQLGINSQESQIGLEPTIPLSQVTLCIKWQNRKVQSQTFTMKGR